LFTSVSPILAVLGLQHQGVNYDNFMTLLFLSVYQSVLIIAVSTSVSGNHACKIAQIT